MCSLNLNKKLEWEPLPQGHYNLKEFTTNFIESLLSTQTVCNKEVNLKILVNYRYSLVANDNKTLQTELPILLTYHTLFSTDDSIGREDLADKLSASILTWFKLLSPSIFNGVIVFSGYIFSDFSESENTIQHLNRNFEVSIQNVTDICYF